LFSECCLLVLQALDTTEVLQGQAVSVLFSCTNFLAGGRWIDIVKSFCWNIVALWSMYGVCILGVKICVLVGVSSDVRCSCLQDDVYQVEYDGASKSNPGPAGAGALVRRPDGSVVCACTFGDVVVLWFSLFVAEEDILG
jgi:hypothetical protein